MITTILAQMIKAGHLIITSNHLLNVSPHENTMSYQCQHWANEMKTVSLELLVFCHVHACIHVCTAVKTARNSMLIRARISITFQSIGIFFPLNITQMVVQYLAFKYFVQNPHIANKNFNAAMNEPPMAPDTFESLINFESSTS